MARTLPTLGVSPCDFYGELITRPMGYFESTSVTANIATVYCKATLTGSSNNLGVAGYFETHLAGATGLTYGFGSWINLDAATPSSVITPMEVGVYEGSGCTMTNARVVLMQLQGILTNSPSLFHIFRVNTTKTITAIIAAANAGSVCFATGETASTSAGTIALADVTGYGVVYVQVYTTSG